MNARTLKALKGSIAKWKAIVAGTGFDRGPANCDLCALFWQHGFCRGCPVMERTGCSQCAGTPYDQWLAANGHGETADTQARKKAARAELAFLKSLLPRRKPR